MGLMIFTLISLFLTKVAAHANNMVQIKGQSCEDRPLPNSPGLVDGLDVCVELCEASSECQSVTIFASKWCSHFSNTCMDMVQNEGAITITPEVNFQWALVGYGKECQDTHIWKKKQESLAKCIESCDLAPECKSISFFDSKWCSHFSTTCARTKTTAKAASMVKSTRQTQCDTGAGEVYRGESSGKVSDLAACKKSCEDAPACQSITFWKDGWCSHFSTLCTKKKFGNEAISMRLRAPATAAPTTTASPTTAAPTTAAPTTAAPTTAAPTTAAPTTATFTTVAPTTAVVIAKAPTTTAAPPTTTAARTTTTRPDSSRGDRLNLRCGVPGGKDKFIKDWWNSNEAACKKACEDNAACRAITFETRANGWCRLWSTPCLSTGSFGVSIRLKQRSWGGRLNLHCGAPGGKDKYISGTRSTEAACKKACEDNAACQAITIFFADGWCSLWSTPCLSTASFGVSIRLKGSSTWFLLETNAQCNTYQSGTGEKYMSQSPGKLSDLEACKKSCKDASGCKSITFFNSGWCSHYSTHCISRWSKSNAISMRWGVWPPKSNLDLYGATGECLNLSPTDCSKGPHGPIGSWDVSAVTATAAMFYSESAFNGDLSKWDVSSVTDMHRMFSIASSFNGDLSKWDVSSVTDTEYMFYFASSFNGDLSKWDVSSVTNMQSMFFSALSFNRDLSKWDVSSVANMHRMFYGARSFNGDLSKWDVSSVTTMYGMFYGARSFNSDLSKWDVSSVTTMHGMFEGASAFSRTLCGAWKDSTAEKLIMFVNSGGRFCSHATTTAAPTAAAPTTGWFLLDTKAECDAAALGEEYMRQSPGKLPDLAACKKSCKDASGCKSITFFNSGWCSHYSTDCTTRKPATNAISMRWGVWPPKFKWDLIAAVNECLNLSPTYCSKGPYGPIRSWDVSAVTHMHSMFNRASYFNGDLSKWDVSRVTRMDSMFSWAESFNGDISKWDVSSVTRMDYMFYHARSFNGDVSKWDVSSVTQMDRMFLEASSFSRTLCGAWKHSTASKSYMLKYSGGHLC